VIVAGLSAAMSGFAIWGHDVGGYQNTHFSPVSPSDLFRRWAQFGCFSPIMQMHREVDRHNLRQYPWGYPAAGETTEKNSALENYRFYARLHTQLFPYLYTYAKRASETGVPILRPLVLMNPDDARTYGVQHAYYFGEELVAPVIEPLATQRQVYLPRGGWYDYWTGQRHDGGQDVTWHNDDPTKVPLFVREGGIVPLLLTEPDTLCDANYVNNQGIKTPDNGLHFLTYPAGSSEFTAYDGTKLQCQANGVARQLTLTSSGRPVLLQVLGDEPAGVTVGGAGLQKVSTPAELAAAVSGWSYDASGQFVYVKFHHGGDQAEIRF
jgi:alpha-glucosidase (family GH31 glycosyl hydrolase)